jgi:SpoVK/Ycf46/Vps4 family AAA+-type ATPase
MPKRKNEDIDDPLKKDLVPPKSETPTSEILKNDPPPPNLPPSNETPKNEPANKNKKIKIEKKPVVREKVIINQKLETLDDLIELAQKYDPTKDYNFNLKKLHKILPPLIKLKNVIGMKSVKDSIVGQIVFFLNEFDGGKNQDMLHTIIQGPPGVGKTTLGKIIGELYYYLDIIKPVAKKVKAPPKPPQPKLRIISLEQLLNMELDHYMSQRKDPKGGDGGKGGGGGKKKDEEIVEDEDDDEEDGDCGCDDDGEEGWGGVGEEGKGGGEGKEGDTFKFKIVKRADLIGQYLGTTSKLTQKVIDDCDGGVMFIDEAYSLGNEEKRDSFAKECLDTINQNLSEKKCNFLCIIAGYKDALDKCFFAYNEGLRRRFPFVYTIEKYTAEELCEIFKKMITDIGWFANEVPEKFFKDNYECFSNMGGDMESLLFLCKINSAKRTLFDPENKKKINLKDLENSFKQFKVNKDLKMDKDDAKDAPWRSMYT